MTAHPMKIVYKKMRGIATFPSFSFSYSHSCIAQIFSYFPARLCDRTLIFLTSENDTVP